MSEKLVISCDNFNSEIFNKAFGNIDYYDENITSKEILTLINNSIYNFIGIKINSTDFKAIYNFQKAGFYLVDALVTYEFDSTKTEKLDDDFSIEFAEHATKDDIDNLSNIAANVFKIDRFHSDPNLSYNSANEYYKKWVINSFNGFADGAILPMINNQIVGFTTYKINNINNHTSTMVLSAVDSNFMGRGVYYNMIKKGTNILLKNSKKIRVGTQIDNIPVQRTWQKLGYKLIDIKYIFHYSK
jgi:ribosomal protein S18 acetylase RimI-like enzyme